MELDPYNSSLSNGTLTLNFNTVYDGNIKNDLVAGTPYIIKWDNNPSSTIVDPVFTGVTISNTANNVSFTGGQFKGSYDYQQFSTATPSILFLGNNNTLYYPEGGASIGACRAFFDLNETDVKSFVLSFDGSSDGISPIPSHNEGNIGVWYDLSGRKMSAKPTQRGIYIHNGRRIVIK